ncbi:MAG: hypothetical protein ACRC6C_00265, partial [Wolbachia pipientis]
AEAAITVRIDTNISNNEICREETRVRKVGNAETQELPKERKEESPYLVNDTSKETKYSNTSVINRHDPDMIITLDCKTQEKKQNKNSRKENSTQCSVRVLPNRASKSNHSILRNKNNSAFFQKRQKINIQR